MTDLQTVMISLLAGTAISGGVIIAILFWERWNGITYGVHKSQLPEPLHNDGRAS